MSNMKELIEKYVGKDARIFVGGLTVDVEVKDVKVSYGKERYLVSPLSGIGQVWVESLKVIEA